MRKHIHNRKQSMNIRVTKYAPKYIVAFDKASVVDRDSIGFVIRDAEVPLKKTVIVAGSLDDTYGLARKMGL